ncbi:MAG: DUF2961 domain-containing protein [Thermoguttaceae bacterium]|nr:DUF2961 domain-containing protein [Thermoguttaceae bacterium]
MRNFLYVFTAVLIFGLISNLSIISAQEVTFHSLLNEMVDLQAVLKPTPEFTCGQFSSFDRKAKSPAENWFANADHSQFLREETRNGQKEYVLMESKGPGAVVRWWITAPAYETTFFIYVDGAKEPTFAGKADDLIGGSYFCESPLSQETARGRNLYLPIPYAKSIKITCAANDKQKALYYQINYRAYSQKTTVESLTPEILQNAQSKISTLNQRLKAPITPAPNTAQFTNVLKVAPNDTLLGKEFDSDGMLTRLTVAIQDKDPEKRTQALRSTILEITFDDQKTVICPIGDFFGSGVGINPYHTCLTEVRENGEMSTYWPMPFKKNAKIAFRNLGNESVTLTISGESSPLEKELQNISENDFLYFCANWHQEREIQTIPGKGTKDWNYLTLEGRGVFVGDVLAIRNSVSQWWGEGDEKIYVDGETFPSHFGTGTEDYYGYAWCQPKTFSSPWRAQPRAEGPGNFGNTTNLRFRTLDRIPFSKNFRFDMEIWHWANAKVDYAVSVFWYGTKTTKLISDSTRSLENEAKAAVSYRTKFELSVGPFKFSKQPQSGTVQPQNMKSFKNGKWLNDSQLWWHGGNPGSELELEITIPKNAQKMTLGLTKACDYGIFEFYLDGKKLDPIFDACHPVTGGNGVIRENLTIDLPKDLVKSDKPHSLIIYLIGKSRLSTGTMFGMDSITFK